jgi:hypothetical protein
MAKHRYKTFLLPELERRTKVISGEFNSEDIANTCAFATMGTKPGELAEAISGEFQVAGHCKHAVGVRDDGNKAGGADDGGSLRVGRRR